VFLDPDFRKNVKIAAIRVYLRQIYDYVIFAWIFRTYWHKTAVWGQNREMGGAILTPPANSFLLLGVLTSVPILVKIGQEMPP